MTFTEINIVVDFVKCLTLLAEVLIKSVYLPCSKFVHIQKLAR